MTIQLETDLAMWHFKQNKKRDGTHELVGAVFACHCKVLLLSFFFKCVPFFSGDWHGGISLLK